MQKIGIILIILAVFAPTVCFATTDGVPKATVEHGLSFGTPCIAGLRVAFYGEMIGLQTELSVLPSGAKSSRFYQRTDVRLHLKNPGSNIANKNFLYLFAGLNSHFLAKRDMPGSNKVGLGLDLGIGLIGGGTCGIEFGLNIPMIDRSDDSFWDTQAVLTVYYVMQHPIH